MAKLASPCCTVYVFRYCRKSGEDESDEGDDEPDEEEEEEEDSSVESRCRDSRAGLRQELAAAVNKIFELREIIRSLELQMESRDRAAKVGLANISSY